MSWQLVAVYAVLSLFNLAMLYLVMRAGGFK